MSSWTELVLLWFPFECTLLWFYSVAVCFVGRNCLFLRSSLEDFSQRNGPLYILLNVYRYSICVEHKIVFEPCGFLGFKTILSCICNSYPFIYQGLYYLHLYIMKICIHWIDEWLINVCFTHWKIICFVYLCMYVFVSCLGRIAVCGNVKLKKKW